MQRREGLMRRSWAYVILRGLLNFHRFRLCVKTTMENFQLLRLPQVLQIIGIKKSTLYDWQNPKSRRYDASFPRPVKIGPATVAWVSEEVQKWLELKIKSRG